MCPAVSLSGGLREGNSEVDICVHGARGNRPSGPIGRQKLHIDALADCHDIRSRLGAVRDRGAGARVLEGQRQAASAVCP